MLNPLAVVHAEGLVFEILAFSGTWMLVPGVFPPPFITPFAESLVRK
jgi:hypothetical protein